MNKLPEWAILVRDYSSARNERVHVEGWPTGCVFILEDVVGDVKHLVTAKSRKKYLTRKRLYYTKEW
jgi:hypothetical protein